MVLKGLDRNALEVPASFAGEALAWLEDELDVVAHKPDEAVDLLGAIERRPKPAVDRPLGRQGFRRAEPEEADAQDQSERLNVRSTAGERGHPVLSVGREPADSPAVPLGAGSTGRTSGSA